MAGGGRPDVSSDATDGGPSPTVLSLVLPLHDTTGTDRDWLAGHLWYLTDYLLLLVLLPVGMLAARRIRPTVAAALLGLVVLEAGPALGLPTLTGAARVGVGDLLCYGLFAVLGIAGATRPPTALTSSTVTIRAAAAGLALVAASLLAGRFVAPSLGSLNESCPLLAVAALGWLLLIGAAERPLRRWAARPRVATTSRAISARALTIYLWHPAAILLALSIVPTEGLFAGPTVLLLTGCSPPGRSSASAGWRASPRANLRNGGPAADVDRGMSGQRACRSGSPWRRRPSSG